MTKHTQNKLNYVFVELECQGYTQKMEDSVDFIYNSITDSGLDPSKMTFDEVYQSFYKFRECLKNGTGIVKKAKAQHLL